MARTPFKVGDRVQCGVGFLKCAYCDARGSASATVYADERGTLYTRHTGAPQCPGVGKPVPASIVVEQRTQGGVIKRVDADGRLLVLWDGDKYELPSRTWEVEHASSWETARRRLLERPPVIDHKPASWEFTLAYRRRLLSEMRVFIAAGGNPIEPPFTEAVKNAHYLSRLIRDAKAKGRLHDRLVDALKRSDETAAVEAKRQLFARGFL